MADMQEQVNDIREDVAYIRAKIDQIPDHESRIRNLERWIWGIPLPIVLSVLAFVFH